MNISKCWSILNIFYRAYVSRSNFSIQSNIVDPDQTAQRGEQSDLNLQSASKTIRQYFRRYLAMISSRRVKGIPYLLFISCMLGNFSCFCCRLLTFFKILFRKFRSETLSECQTVWILLHVLLAYYLLSISWNYF